MSIGRSIPIKACVAPLQNVEFVEETLHQAFSNSQLLEKLQLSGGLDFVRVPLQALHNH